MSKSKAIREDWSGLTFANGWTIQKKLSCAEYRAIYKAATGEEKIIKNTHYLCHNEICGVDSYLERTVIQRVMNNGTQVLSKCKGCINGSKKGECHYSTAVREKNLTKIPDRSQKIDIGSTYGVFTVQKLFPSANSTNHQQTVEVKCNICGNVKIASANGIAACTVACDCFRNHSTGEAIIKNYLDNRKIEYKSEYTFANLYGLGGGSLRYDFAILKNKELVGLIEFDGEQHFQEAGSYFNEKGQVQIHDKMKNEYAEQNNIPMLRIPYTECQRIDEILDNWFKNLF